MKNLSLAAFLSGNPTDGGAYVHKVGVLRVLKRMQGPDLSVIAICDTKDNLCVAREIGLTAILWKNRYWKRVLGAIAATEFVRKRLPVAIGRRISPLSRLLVRMNVDLVLFSSPDRQYAQLYSQSFIFSILDLAHLEYPEFPEVSHCGEFERRESLYELGARKAIAVIADSEPSRRLIAAQYRVSQSRIYAAPFLTHPVYSHFEADVESAADIVKRYRLSSPYIFYPAQFWPHKNHRYILRALKCLRERCGWAPQAVFCGSDKGSLNSVLREAREIGVDDLINYCGFVPDRDLPYLYRGALALVMPTYFGPNNIPPLEARALGVPVIYSDFPSFREQMGDTVVYVDLSDPNRLASEIQEINLGNAVRNKNQSDDAARLCDHASEAYLEVLRLIIKRYRGIMY